MLHLMCVFLNNTWTAQIDGLSGNIWNLDFLLSEIQLVKRHVIKTSHGGRVVEVPMFQIQVEKEA